MPWVGGSTRAWRKTRLIVLTRDNYRCQLQLPNICTTKATHVHHVLGKGVSESLADLQSACEACNLHLGKPKGDPKVQPNTKW